MMKLNLIDYVILNSINMANQAGRTYFDVEYFAVACDISRVSASNHINALIKNGYINRQNKNYTVTENATSALDEKAERLRNLGYGQF